MSTEGPGPERAVVPEHQPLPVCLPVRSSAARARPGGTVVG